ncbi:MAG: hypothetical protein IT436_17580 [Phycisphaerales bacterium]|nr:hypothetical protein [Phycisphaerales bacterium]
MFERRELPLVARIPRRFAALSVVPQTTDVFGVTAERSCGITRTMGEYRCVATSLSGFVQQLAVSYLGHGYWFYVTGRIPDGKEPSAVDRKLIARYGIDISKWARARRKRAGLANLQYLRHERFFVLLATHGTHEFFEREKNQLRDARRVPVRYAGYSMSFRGGHPHVRIDQRRYLELKAQFVELATHRQRGVLAKELWNLPFEPYAPVRRQLLNILRAMNRVRRTAGFDKLTYEALGLRREVVRPFGAESGGEERDLGLQEAPGCGIQEEGARS